MARGGAKRGDNSSRIVILRSEETVSAAHHGGSWKIAYADFVTAMMAFFLVMWLINATTEEQRRGIASFFNPLAVDSTQPLDSMVTVAPQPLAGSRRSPPAGQPAPPHTTFQNTIQDADAAKSAANIIGKAAGEAPVFPDDRSARRDDDRLAGSRPRRGAVDPQARATAEVDHVRSALRASLRVTPLLAGMLSQVRVSGTSNEIRISLEDTDHQPMFPRGQIAPDRHAVALLRAIAPVVTSMPGTLTISGFTDASSYRVGQINNWSLSALRADATREVLQQAGFPAARISDVSGHADSELADPDHPLAAINRRVVLTLTRKMTGPTEGE